MQTLSEYQLAVLSQLGIDYWQQRHTEQANDAMAISDAAPVESEPSASQDTPAFCGEPVEKRFAGHPLVTDIRHWLQHVSPQQSVSWQIGDEIKWEQQQLITPAPDKLAASANLKKQLWQQLQNKQD